QVFVNVGSNAVPGTYSVIISGTAPFAGGFLTQTATLTLTISQTIFPDFSIVANPNSVTILRGSLGLVNVTLSSMGGFNGTISITTGSSGDFSLFTSPSSIITAQNSTRSFGVVALSLNGFAGNVSISTSNVPSGVGVQFLGPSPPTLIVPSDGNATIIAVLNIG